MLTVILYFAMIIGSVLIAKKLGNHVGFFCLAVAFVVGRLVYGLSNNDLIGYWPTSMMWIMIFATAYIGFLNKSGAMRGIAVRVMRLSGGRTWLVPFLLYLMAYVLNALNCGKYGGPVITSSIAFSVAANMGINPVLCVVAIYTGLQAGCRWPWVGDSAAEIGQAEEFVGLGTGVDAVYRINTFMFIEGLVLFAILYLITKPWCASKKGDVLLERPEPFTNEQKKSLWFLLATIVLMMVPPIIQNFLPNPITLWITTYIDVRMIFTVGIVICSLFKLADPIEVIKNDVPWSLILTICGACTLCGLASAMGVQETLIDGLSKIPSWLVCPSIMLIGGLLTIFVDGTAFKFALFPLVDSLAALANVTPLAMFTCIVVSVSMSAISPLSTGGALHLTGCTDDTVRKEITTKMLAVALLAAVLGTVLALLGIFNLF